MDISKLKENLNKIGKEVVASVVNELIKADKKATGSLINSIDYEILNTANGLMLNILANDYFDYVDGGRRPGSKMPPVKAIIPWVQSKNIVFTNRRGIQLSKESTAFLISKSISNKGIRPLNIKQKVVSDILNNKKKFIEEGIFLDFNKYINEQIFNINKNNKNVNNI